MSSSTDTSPIPEQLPTNPSSDEDELVENLENVQLEESAQESSDSSSSPDASNANSDDGDAPRPLILYTRKELLNLSISPLVKLPDKMPAFKVWFGELEPTPPQGKKESEQVTGNGADKGRRYRRDAEDGDGSSRPPFRSTMSQPSQMGNFKHQPLRGADRDRETERNLRNLSEKFDREKGRVDHLGLPTSSTLLRNRDRETAPHLASARGAGRKREGETGDDWRRAPEASRTTRDDNGGRRDRDDRDRPRSGARDTSRNRTSPQSRREEKGGEKRNDRERADDAFSRRDRDRDRFPDTEDEPWRDVAKKEDRRRDRFRLDREGGKSQETDKGHAPRDYREALTLGADEKDGRGQKRGGRERRQGDASKEDRRDRDKDEPAWMENYVPPASSSTGVFGKTVDGEMDSIQAWKKDMKAREQRAKGIPVDSSTQDEDLAPQPAPPPPPPATLPLGALDEIQQFKLMMKKEEEKRSAANSATALPSTVESSSASKSPAHTLDPASALVKGQDVKNSFTMASSTDAHVGAQKPDSAAPAMTIDLSNHLNASRNSATSSPATSLAPSRLVQDALGPALAESSRTDSNVSRFFPSAKPDASLASSATQALVNRETQSPSASFDPPRQSRLLAFGSQARTTSSQGGLQGVGQSSSGNGTGLARTPEAGTFVGAPEGLEAENPSRLDALWTGRTTASPAFAASFGQQVTADRPAILGQHGMGSAVPPNVDNYSRLQHQELSQFLQNDGASVRSNLALENSRDQFGVPGNHRSGIPDSRSASISLSANERAMSFGSPSDALQFDGRNRNASPPAANFGATSPVSPYEGQVQPASSVGKGSRMAKHFERVNRESISMNGVSRGQMNQAMGLQAREQQGTGLSPPLGGGQARNIADLLTMLNNSAQAQRPPPTNQIMQGQNLPGLQPQHRSQQELLASTGLGVQHESLMEPDDARFTSNNLVPGFRPAHLGRSRDPITSQVFNQLDDGMQVNMNISRLSLQQQQQQQQRLLNEQLAAAQLSSQQFGGSQGPSSIGRAMGVNFQQQPLRGGPSPISNLNPQGIPPHRLPPGLANLGGRPPHEPSQFLGGGVGGNFGMPPQNMHGNLHQGTNSPQSFNQLQNVALGMGAAQPQMRGGGPPGLQHLSNVGGPSLNGMDFRGGGPNISQHQQLMSLGGSGLQPGMRGSGPGFSNQQLQNIPQQPSMSMRQQQQQQQQQQLPPHLLQQMLGGPQMHHIGHNGAHEADLMTLLLRGGGQE